MALQYHVISTDDHIIEPHGMFDGRLPKEFADRTPKLVETEESAAWQVDGVLNPDGSPKAVEMSGLSTAAGQKVEEFSHKPFASALIRAYNDWLIEEWCAPDPERLLGAGILPLWDMEASAAEIRRIAGAGLKCISLPSTPGSVEGVPGFHDEAWAPVWDAMSETGLPAEIHIVSGKADVSALGGLGVGAEIFVALAPSTNMQTVAVLLFSGILRKWPKLKFISAESGIGWLPYFIERADYAHRKHRFWTGSNIDVMPSDLFRQSIYANFISDRAGVEGRHMIGVDNIMIGTDYPHTDSSWPDTQRVIKEQMGDIPQEDREKILWRNAAKVFQLNGAK
jgi:predicted TIM-barrel fold metal-dependent hydrolase